MNTDDESKILELFGDEDPAPDVPPLDDDEWEELGQLLAEPGGPSQAGVDGFLHAIATAPTLIPPSTWLGAVFAERTPTDRSLELISRHYNAVLQGLAGKSPWLPPPSQEQAIAEWCTGYMFGFHIDPKWPDLPDAIQDLAPIAVLAGELPLADLRADLESDPSDDPSQDPVDDETWLQDMREELGFIVVEIYDALAEARRANADAMQTVRRDGPKVGRNDPCPCGSGKKYKKCCLKKLN